MKEDYLPIEIIDNIFIGSIGAASKKEVLLEHKITHVIVAASTIRNYFPEVIISYKISNNFFRK